jgi:ribosomal protein L11 methyltransferase
MTYTQVTIHLHSDDVDTLSEYLFYIGCSGTEVIDHQALFEKHDDHYGEIYSLNPMDYPEEGAILKAYFHDRFDCEQIKAEIEHVIETNGIRLLGDILIEVIKGEDYAETWKDQIQAVEINDQIRIIAPWMEENDQQLHIKIEPGLGFGTGSHPTTKMCLDLLSQYIKEHDQVIDLGCGSGVIAILASKLTKGTVYGIDLDDAALKNAAYNATLNHVSISFNQTMESIKEVDLIVANIVYDILLSLMNEIKLKLKADGICIFSGITLAQADAMKTELISHGFVIETEQQEKEFIAFLARKKVL